MTHRNRSSRGCGLLALTLLALGLAACGGSEPAASVPPPAPSPAPPPFVPQAVEVALGSSGETLTLMTAQDGGFTLAGEAFASGSDVTAQANGSTYTLTLDGTAWSAAYNRPAPVSLALGASGATISIQRLEDGSFQANGSAIDNGTVVTADNGNSYTIMLGDDGAFAAEFVQPPPLSIALGSSGSTVQARINEDRSFSALLDGQWTLITADTRLTAANGNVYGVQFADGLPRPLYAGHSQQVMLGALGGTLTLTRAEDMRWWLGETEVKHGHVHRAANGNDYVLSLNAEGHWSAIYQKVVLNVTLGTQGSIGLERAEDMSWWHGSEAVGVGSEVNSANGNTYTLWYADGAWTARFEPEERMIAGTRLTAYTREADDMYDVGGATLPASGTGDVTVDGAMYHVWMQGGALAGARFDKAIDNETRYVDREQTDTNKGIKFPGLSAEDAKMAGNQARTHLLVTGTADTGRGSFSIGDLLGSGTASDRGKGFVDEAVTKIEKVRADVAALLALDTKPTTLETILDGQWNTLKKALDPIFGTKSTLQTGATSAVRANTPREEDILGEIAAVLDALASEPAFVAATHADRDSRGVFRTQALGAGPARDAFKRVRWSAEATLGMTGSTRYGTALRKTSGTARDKPSTSEYGAFSYATMQETQRTAHAAAASLTGVASYAGGTRAVSGSGKHYAGQVEVQVRFRADTVSGVVSGLADADGKPWMHNFAAVDKIVLGEATLRRNAKWKQPAANNTAIVFYTAESGLLRPVEGIRDTFEGVLLGRGADAGSEANGVWSVGDPTGTTYLAGGFGVRHVDNVARPVPTQDDGSAAGAKLIHQRTVGADAQLTSSTIKDGMLTVKTRSFDWTRNGNTVSYAPLGASGDETLITSKFDLAEMVAAGDEAKSVVDGPKWVDRVVSILTKERDLLSALQDLKSDDTQAAERAAWQRVQDAVHYRLLGGSGGVDLNDDNDFTDPNELPAQSRLPLKLAKNYDGDTNALGSEAEAIDLINKALDALSSNANLAEAFNPDGTGIFDHFDSGTADDPATDARENEANFVNAAKTKIANRTFAQMRNERTHQVTATLGTTSYTRFGVWWRQSSRSAIRQPAFTLAERINVHGGPGMFAYSPLDATNAGTATNPGFPKGGSASYAGKTVATHWGTILTGTVRVDVSWNTLADTSNGLNAQGGIAQAGTMSLTLSGLASAAGDPLVYRDSPSTPDPAPHLAHEIAEIVLSGLTIRPNANGDLAVVSNTGNQVLMEGGPATRRFRYSDSGRPDRTSSPEARVGALFVGRGVDGPLGVIGTYQLSHSRLARLSADGQSVEDRARPVYGAFGAEAP